MSIDGFRKIASISFHENCINLILTGIEFQTNFKIYHGQITIETRDKTQSDYNPSTTGWQWQNHWRAAAHACVFNVQQPPPINTRLFIQTECSSILSVHHLLPIHVSWFASHFTRRAFTMSQQWCCWSVCVWVSQRIRWSPWSRNRSRSPWQSSGTLSGLASCISWWDGWSPWRTASPAQRTASPDPSHRRF